MVTPPSLFLPLSPHPPLHFHSSTPFHNYSPHTPSLISRAFQFCRFKVGFCLIFSFSNYIPLFYFLLLLLAMKKKNLQRSKEGKRSRLHRVMVKHSMPTKVANKFLQMQKRLRQSAKKPSHRFEIFFTLQELAASWV